MQNTPSFKVYNASAGSGKTFTLVKEFIKILLLSSNPYKFQQVLAVTFTNKAAGEMKERIIKNLDAFSKEEVSDMLQVICNETSLDETTVFSRSKKILNAILQNYSAFNITTIDAFTHKIIRTFAYDLKLPLTFDVEMDAESLLNEAVDIVISKIGESKELTELLVSYSLQKLDDDKSWDISQELKAFAKIILNENHATHLKQLSTISIDEFKKLKATLQKENSSIEKGFIEIGIKGLKIISENGLEISEFGYGGELPKHFVKLQKFKQLKADDLKFEGRLNKTIEENKNLYAGKCSASTKQLIDQIAPELKELYYQSKNYYSENFGNYILNSLIIESLIPLSVLNYINKALQELKQENNILLNAEFNQLIGETIKDEPAPFIYERLGEKFRYYFIDEMQDTSTLQWQNLIPLIDNAISSENEFGEQGKLLLVGDAKQSIYRWRGGKAEQFISLSSKENKKETNPFYIEKNVLNLDTNFRSFSEIIDFNNNFFKYSSQFLTNESYRNLYVEGNNQNSTKKEGGFVQVSFVEKRNDDEEKELVFPKKVYEIISNLDTSFLKSEICVLVRKKDQGIAVANYLSEKGIEIISSETLLLSNNDKVKFIIDLLYVLQNPTNKEYKVKLLYFLYEFLHVEEEKHHFLNRFIHLENAQFFEALKQFNVFFNYNEFIKNPFYESIEYIVRSFNLVTETDSNIQFFLDVVFEFQQTKQVAVESFLEYWELKKDKLSVVAPEAKNAVRIMTIHKAKGLEFPIVIFPYDIEIYRQINPKVWYNYEQSNTINSILVNYSTKLNYVGEQGEQLFNQQKEELELDNFNLLYVALTRAVEQLYVISDKNLVSKNSDKISTTASLFVNYLKDANKWNEEINDYSFGSSKRVSELQEFESSTKLQEKFISTSWKNHNISIVTNSSLLWDTEQGAAISYGNLIHEILAKIKTKDDVLPVVQQYVFKGIINSFEMNAIVEVVNKVISNKELSKYFEQNNEILTEREIITDDKTIVIPDRLVFDENSVTIIDYKTGKPDEKHHQQLKEYTKTLEKLNYKVEKKLLVYINEEIFVEEV